MRRQYMPMIWLVRCNRLACWNIGRVNMWSYAMMWVVVIYDFIWYMIFLVYLVIFWGTRYPILSRLWNLSTCMSSLLKYMMTSCLELEKWGDTMYFSIKTASGVQVFRYNLTQIERKIRALYDYLCIMHHYINFIQFP